MSTEQNLFQEHEGCRKCIETVQGEFRYIETREGEKITFEMRDKFILVFVLKGKAVVSCNEFVSYPVSEGEMILWPKNSRCTWKSVTETASIVMEGTNDIPMCDRKALKEHAHEWLSIPPAFNTLRIKPRLNEFLSTIKNYLEDEINCPQMYNSKRLELSSLFRAYYSPEELGKFFLPVAGTTYEFETFIMNNYLNMKGLMEFVDLSGMSVSTFKRKFKSRFQMSPYQWLIKQKSKHIYEALSDTDRRFSEIAKEFRFTDASHFNRYCKAMFGASPTDIRKKQLE